MTLTIELTPVEEARLAVAAKREGIEPAALVKRLVAEHLPQGAPVDDDGHNGTAPAAGVIARNHLYVTATPEQQEAAMDEFAAGGEGLPVLSDGLSTARTSMRIGSR